MEDSRWQMLDSKVFGSSDRVAVKDGSHGLQPTDRGKRDACRVATKESGPVDRMMETIPSAGFLCRVATPRLHAGGRGLKPMATILSRHATGCTG